MANMVNGVEIAEQKIIDRMDAWRGEYERNMRKNGEEPSEKQLREWVIEDLIENMLVREEAARTQPVPADRHVRRELKVNEEDYIDVEEGRRFQEAQLALQARRMVREWVKGAAVPDEALLHEHYESYLQSFVQPETLEMSALSRYVEVGLISETHILLLQIKSDVEAGRVTWEEALLQFSETSRDNLGYFPEVPRGALDKAIEDKIFSVPEGAISDVVELNLKLPERVLSLFKIKRKLPERQLSFEEIRDELRKGWIEKNRQDLVFKKIDELKEAAVIELED